MGSSCPGICILGDTSLWSEFQRPAPQQVLVVESGTFEDVRVHLVTVVFTEVWVHFIIMIFFEWVDIFLFECDTFKMCEFIWSMFGIIWSQLLVRCKQGLGNSSSYWNCSTWDKNLAFEWGSHKKYGVWNRKLGFWNFWIRIGLGKKMFNFENLVLDFYDVHTLMKC